MAKQKYKYKCQSCNKKFGQKQKLTEHLKTHRKGTGNMMKREDAMKIKLKRSKESHVCLVCSKKFKSKFKLARHSYIHLDVKPFACDICDKRFRRKDHLRIHYRLHTGENRSYCHICTSSFNTKAALDKHMQTFHSGTREENLCPYCEITFTYKSQLNRHFDEIHREYYTCMLCGFTSCTSAAFYRHGRSHMVTRPFSCLTCDITFAGLSELTNHVCNGDSDKDDGCVVLKVVLDDSDLDNEENDMVDHNEAVKILRKFDRRGRKPKNSPRVHEENNTISKKMLSSNSKKTPTEAVFRCKYCDKVFTDKISHFQHEAAHVDSMMPTDENFIKCGICSQSFASKEDLDTHLPSHFVNDGDLISSHPCSQCHDNFPTMLELEQHCKDVHSTDGIQHSTAAINNVCSFCKVIFPDQYELSVHINNEHSSESFKCSYCTELFVSQSAKAGHEHICTYNVKTKTPLLEPPAVKASVSMDFVDEIDQLINGVSSVKQDSMPTEITDSKSTDFPEVKLETNAVPVTKYIPEKFENSSNQCKECGGIFTTPHDLLLHVRTHSCMKTHSELLSCMVCEATFTTGRALNDHLNTHEGPLEMFQNF